MTRRPRSPLRRIAVAARRGDAELRERLAVEVAAATDLVWDEDSPDVLIVDRARMAAPDESYHLVLIGDVDPAVLPATVFALLPADASPRTIVSTARLGASSRLEAVGIGLRTGLLML
jgi:hypothetical protein